MAAPASLTSLLDSLTQSLTSAVEATPTITQIEPPKEGVSLLDIKNEVLLSYLHNLVFLILVKIRRSRRSDAAPEEENTILADDIIKKLVELRLYLEKGVLPLEDKLGHILSTILRALGDSERQSSKPNTRLPTTDSINATGSGSDIDPIESEDDDESDSDAEGRSKGGTGSAPSALNFSSRPTAQKGMAAAAASSADETAVYRAPKRNPTLMPSERRERAAERKRHPTKSATMDEYIASEYSHAPTAELSIGTNILDHGRRVRTEAERKNEDLRREYEETNLVRLPAKSKKERAREAKMQGRTGRMTFGGEEFRELREGVDRIEGLTRRKEGSKGTRALLERSRKRGFHTADGPRDGGGGIGERFQKRLKNMDGRKARR